MTHHPATSARAASPERAATGGMDSVAGLDADLLAGPTATAALSRRCGGGPVRAVLDTSVTRDADAQTRARLGVAADVPISYRRVRLYCGDRLLSVADNWFVPARLTAAMVAALDHSECPFGTVIAPFAPRRRTLSVDHLWDGKGAAPETVLRHHALVFTGEGVALAEVIEEYRREALARI